MASILLRVFASRKILSEGRFDLIPNRAPRVLEWFSKPDLLRFYLKKESE